MSLETPRHGVQLELSRARLVQFAECLVFPNHSRGGHAGGGFALARFASVRCLERGAPVCNYISFDGRHPGDARLHFRTRTDHARVADFADAADLSADAELLHLESNFARDQRRMGELGQTRAHRQRASAGIIKKHACASVSRRLIVRS